MPCYRPLTAWRGPVLPSGKRSVVFKPTESTGGLFAFPQKLPCGQCIGCRLDYSLDWATRCIHESQMHKENCFITLTYDQKNVPNDGLQLRDWQLFMKRLRKEVGNVRYFHAGEYGELQGRPHDHALLFGFNFPDRKAFKVTSSGSPIDTSAILQRLWPFGYSSVGDVTFESAAYVARYCLKKITGKGKDVEDVRGLKPYERMDVVSGEVTSIRPEYVTMSRRPGIAKGWFEKFCSDVFPHGYVVVRDGAKMPPPRYYDGLYELLNPDDLKRIKQDRVIRCQKKELTWNDELRKMQLLDANRDERLEVMELCKERQLSVCRKKLESGR